MAPTIKNSFFSPSSAILVKKILRFLVPAVFFVIVFACIRFRNVFEYNVDEGMYTMRAFLHLKGYALYKQIWMDQPPVLVLILSYFFKTFGASIFLARLVTLLFSTLFIWAIYGIISKTQNTLSALWAAITIIFSLSYLYFSVSAVATIPVIATAVLSIYCLLCYEDTGKKRFIILSAIIFALALMIKFLAVIFLPGMLVEMFISGRSKKTCAESHACFPGLILLWFITFFAAILYIIRAASIDLSQIIQPYVLARKIVITGQPEASRCLFQWFKDASGVVPLVLCALIFTKRGQRKFFLVPLINLASVILVFSTHRPLWSHYYLYIIFPLSWLASYGIYALCNLIGEEWKNRNTVLSGNSTVKIICFSLALGFSLTMTYLEYPHLKWQLIKPELDSRRQDSGNRCVIDLMKGYAPKTHMVVTDRLIYAFYAGLPVHPYLATVSSKRIYCGLLTAKDYINIIIKERPELVLLTEETKMLGGNIEPFLKKDYELSYENECSGNIQKLYISKKIKRGFSEK
jgi:hypothetical protein